MALYSSTIHNSPPPSKSPSGSPPSSYSESTRDSYVRRIDSFRVIDQSVEKDDNIKIDKVGNIVWSGQQQSRCGVIPYFIFNEEMYFILGMDEKTGDLTDFGGWIGKNDSNSLAAALREFNEESLNTFGNIDWQNESLQDMIVVYSTSMMIIFAHFDIDIQKTFNLFERRRDKILLKGNTIEVSSMFSIGQKHLEKLIFNNVSKDDKHLYFRVSVFLQNTLRIDPHFFEKLI